MRPKPALAALAIPFPKEETGLQEVSETKVALLEVQNLAFGDWARSVLQLPRNWDGTRRPP